MTDGLKDEHRTSIVDVLNANERVERALLFGSRAMGTFTQGSDVDIALFGESLTTADQAGLATAMEELTIPQRIDLVLYEGIENEVLREHVQRHGVELYKRHVSRSTQSGISGSFQDQIVNSVDIRSDHLKIVQDILCTHLPGSVKVWVFGSRAAWTTKDSSDLDLAVEGDTPLDFRTINMLQDAFEDSSLPYTVDVVDMNRVSGGFRHAIEEHKTLLAVPESSSEMGTRDRNRQARENEHNDQAGLVIEKLDCCLEIVHHL